MPTTGLEPVRRFRHWSLKPACLPIPARGPRPSRGVAARDDDEMLGEGLEPSRGCPHRILNPARLPIPPSEPAVIRADGAEGSRTPDLLNAIQALSQLSYSPVPPSSAALESPTSLVKHRGDVAIHDPSPFDLPAPAGLTGFEPATSGVTDRHSNQLSYSPRARPSTARSRRTSSCCTRAGDRSRTGDLHVGNVTLYQLSYARVVLTATASAAAPTHAPKGNRTPITRLKASRPSR